MKKKTITVFRATGLQGKGAADEWINQKKLRLKKSIITAFLLLITASCQSQPENKPIFNNQIKSEMNLTAEKQAIEKMLFSYRDALNTSDVSIVLPLYTQDGVFMPSGAPSAIGQEQIKGSYEFVFKTIQLKIEFFIDEIIINDDYAFVRTTSKGTTLIHSSGQTVPEENRELFVLQKVDGQWKIARYMFNKMK